MKTLLLSNLYKPQIAKNYCYINHWCLYKKTITEVPKELIITDWWEKRKLLKQAACKLKIIHEIILEELSRQLNTLHDVNLGLKDWRLILDPWLVAYLAVLFDRYKRISDLVKKKKKREINVIFIKTQQKPKPPKNYSEFIKNSSDDRWNQELMENIIKFCFKHKFKFFKKIAKFEKINTLNEPNKKNLLIKIFNYIETFLPQQDIVFFKSRFPFLKYVKLNYLLGQIPRSNEFLTSDEFNSKYCAKIRAKFTKVGDTKSPFIDFVFSRIKHDIPKNYIENFRNLYNKANNCTSRPKVIVSAMGHWLCDYFKIWVTIKKSYGAKYFAIEHGGGLPPAFDTAEFEDYIADKRIVWIKPLNNYQTKLPPNKIFQISCTFNTQKYLLLVPWELQRYPVYLSALPGPSSRFFGLNQIHKIMINLPSHIRQQTRIKPYPSLKGDGYLFDEQLKIKYPQQVITNKNLKFCFRNARIISCLYPNTTFSEAIATNKPTVLFFDPKQWEIHDNFKYILTNLRKAKILHYSIDNYLMHIKDIWNNPEKWWSDSKTQLAISIFKKNCLDLKENALAEWARFLKKSAL